MQVGTSASHLVLQVDHVLFISIANDPESGGGLVGLGLGGGVGDDVGRVVSSL